MDHSPRLSSAFIRRSIGIVGLVCVILGIATLDTYYRSLIAPGVTIDGTAVGGMTIDDARALLRSTELSKPANESLTLYLDDIEYDTTTTTLLPTPDYDVLLTVVSQEQTGIGVIPYLRQLYQLQQGARSPKNYTLTYELDDTGWQTLVQELKTKVDTTGWKPEASLEVSGNANTLTVDPGQNWRELDETNTKNAILIALSTDSSRAEVAVASQGAALSDLEYEVALERASALVGTKITLTHESQTLANLTDAQIIAALAFPEGYRRSVLQTTIASIAAEIEQPALEPVFEYDPNTLEVFEFVPPQVGLALDQETLFKDLVYKLSELEEYHAQEEGTATTEYDNSLELPLALAEPTISLAETNDLGINEMIGTGQSRYHHSIPSRVHNVGHAAKLINNTIVAPGEEYSFNETIGDVTKATGFQSAYIIQGGRTVLGDGGGVCQVSSTLFRTLLDSGVQITRRLPHSYRVSYYELNSDPGFDATVYSGSVDLRFINDTGHHLLVHTRNDEPNRHLVIEMYGTDDGRTTEVVGYRTWGWSSQLPAEYIPDASLAPGQTKQIDWGVSGINAEFTHIIRNAGGEVMSEKTYTSRYRPWSSKFLVGQ